MQGIKESMMKAIVQDRYGSPDVLELRDIERPTVGAGEVLIEVRAAGVDPGVWHLMTGKPYLLRLFGFGLRAPKIKVRGMDVAGRVAAVGAGVTRFKPGDEVFGACDGAFAEYAVARADRLAPKPANLGLEQAAVVAISGLAALQAVRDRGRVQAGQRVLIIGAAGGIGTYAVQIARALGAEVTGVCGGSKLELVRSLGAHEVIDYTRTDFADGPRRYDVIVDTAGNRALSRVRRALTPRGTLVIAGGEGGGDWLGGVERQLGAALLSMFVRQRLGGLMSLERQDDLQRLRAMIEAGEVTPVIDRSYPLAEAADAIRYVATGHARGKVVITV